MSGTIYLVIVSVVVILVVIAGLAYIRYDRRARVARNLEMGDWGRRNGLDILDPVDPRTGRADSEVRQKTLSSLILFQVFQAGSGSVSNVLRGSRHGYEVTVFDYDASDGESSLILGAAVIRLARTVPEFEVRAKQGADNMARAFGRQDMTLGHPEFDDEFYIGCADEAFLRRVLGTGSSLTGYEARKQAWYGLGDRLVVTRKGKLNLHEFDKLLADAFDMANRISQPGRL